MNKEDVTEALKVYLTQAYTACMKSLELSGLADRDFWDTWMAHDAHCDGRTTRMRAKEASS